MLWDVKRHKIFTRPSAMLMQRVPTWMQAALSLYLYLGNSILLQLESFLWKLLLPLAEGKGAHSMGRQEAALEVWLPLYYNTTGVTWSADASLHGRDSTAKAFNTKSACTSMLPAYDTHKMSICNPRRPVTSTSRTLGPLLRIVVLCRLSWTSAISRALSTRCS